VDQSRSLDPAVNRCSPKAEGLLQSDSCDEWLDRPRTALVTNVGEFPAAADRRSMTVLKPVARLLPGSMVVRRSESEQTGMWWKPAGTYQGSDSTSESEYPSNRYRRKTHASRSSNEWQRTQIREAVLDDRTRRIWADRVFIPRRMSFVTRVILVRARPAAGMPGTDSKD